jgi:hypothetical protein
MNRLEALSLITELRRGGVELVPHGEMVRYRPKDALTADQQERLGRAKQHVLELLRAEHGQREDVVDVAPPSACCRGCGGSHFWAVARLSNWVCGTCHEPDSSSEQVMWARVRTPASPFGPGRPDEDCGVCEGAGVERLPQARWTICACRERDFHPDPAGRRDAGGAA